MLRLKWRVIKCTVESLEINLNTLAQEDYEVYRIELSPISSYSYGSSTGMPVYTSGAMVPQPSSSSNFNSTTANTIDCIIIAVKYEGS